MRFSFRWFRFLLFVLRQVVGLSAAVVSCLAFFAFLVSSFAGNWSSALHCLLILTLFLLITLYSLVNRHSSGGHNANPLATALRVIRNPPIIHHQSPDSVSRSVRDECKRNMESHNA